MARPRVIILILNWNGKEDTGECLKSLAGIAYTSYDVLIVDNHSSDGSVEYFSRSFPDVRLLENSKNLGFAGGNNVGISYALDRLSPDYILLLNNDTGVDRGFLDELVDMAEKDDGIGIIGPKVYYYGGDRINSAGGKVRWLTGIGKNVGAGEADRGQYDRAAEVDYVQGCALLVKREVFDSIGYLDESFFIYLEDVDFCLRAKKAGYKVVYNPRSVIYHKENRSIKKVSLSGLYYNHRNRLLLLNKHSTLKQRLLAFFPMAAMFNIALIYYAARLDPGAVSTLFKAYLDGLSYVYDHRPRQGRMMDRRGEERAETP